MFKAFLASVALLVGVQSQAMVVHPEISAITQITAQQIRPESLLNWNVGSTADYTLQGGFLNGTMKMQVREATAQGFWVQQDVDLGFLGAQKIEVHYNKDTGEVIELLVNGQKQTPPNPNDMEIVESRREKVTVPKGEFDSVYVKIKDKTKNETSEMWVNPTAVPIGGMIKTIAPSPMGAMTIELTDFKI